MTSMPRFVYYNTPMLGRQKLWWFIKNNHIKRGFPETLEEKIQKKYLGIKCQKKPSRVPMHCKITYIWNRNIF